MKLPAYPKYKPSGLSACGHAQAGVEWLGDVPEHWDVKRLKMAAHLTDKKVEADEENPVPYIGMENIESWTGRLLPINPDVVPTGTANAFKAGHTLFGKLRPYLAKACNPDFDGLCSTELLVLNGVEFDRDSLRYALLSDGFIKLVDSSTYGSKMPRASWDFIGNCVLPIAPPAEQRAIAAFLDRETGRVDRLVAKKRELIERLKEKRTALISRTVTRGLPPSAARAAGLPENPSLKPSGVEWIGDIPTHWEVKKVKFVAKMESGHTPSRSEPSNWVDDECVIPWVSLNDTKHLKEHDYIGDTAVKISEEGMKNSSAHLLPAGVVVFTRDATIGLTAITTSPAAVSQHIIAWVPGPKVTPKYLLLSFKVMQQYLESFTFGSTLKTIGMTDVRKLVTPVPPLPEQAAIAAYLDEETAKLDALVAQVEEAVERLQEYRTALITAAVTGKIDVRAVLPRAPANK
ncbi:MAG: restriction endonuclease subunit S [Verrucomicrobia bacterium]|nr:restriction endonuclease subunit S [Verrucomicrobiota bacterium]